MIIEERIRQCYQIIASKIELESTDVAITKLLNYARKVEGRGKGVPFSREKIFSGPN